MSKFDNNTRLLIVVIALILAVLVTGLAIMSRRTGSEGPTGITSTTVNMPSGRMVECVVLRDVGPTGLAVGVDCDFGR